MTPKGLLKRSRAVTRGLQHAGVATDAAGNVWLVGQTTTIVSTGGQTVTRWVVRCERRDGELDCDPVPVNGIPGSLYEAKPAQAKPPAKKAPAAKPANDDAFKGDLDF